MSVHPSGFIDETAAWRARVAAEVAARYGLAVAPDAVSRVARGVSGLSQIKWDGKDLVFDAPADTWRKAGVRAFKARAQAIRLGVGPGLEAQQRRDEVARLHGLGFYDAQIVAQLGVCLATVRHIRCGLGLESNGHMAQLAVAAARVARVVDMLLRGFAPGAIAAQEGLKEATVKSIGRARLGLSFARASAPSQGVHKRAPRLDRPQQPKPDKPQRAAAKSVRKLHRTRAECDAAKAARQRSVADLSAEGFSQRDIARRLAISPRTVTADLAAEGVTSQFKRGHYYPRTKLIEAMEKRRASVLVHLRQGLSCPSIARLLGYSLTSVREDRTALMASGTFDPAAVPLPPQQQRQAQVLVMLQQGQRRAAIAKALGVGVSTIRDDRRVLIAGGADIAASARGRQKVRDRAVAHA